jgi:prepilin-type N-terminal cleavage/methylation domain-containing protein
MQRLDTTHTNAFTLVELSIVLVIIGLLIGGVLVGRDLVVQAEMRKMLGEIQRLQLAVRTFETRYKCSPGDCAKAGSLGLVNNFLLSTSSSCPNAYACEGNGNGDGIIGVEEQRYFWFHLYDSGIYLSNSLRNISGPPSGIEIESPSLIRDTSIHVPDNSFRDIDYLALLKYSPDCSGGDVCPSLFTREAYYLDSKIDDALPLTGRYRAVGDFVDQIDFDPSLPSAGAVGSANCINNTTTPQSYNVSGLQPDLCLLALPLRQ